MAEQRPEAIALESGSQSLNYGQLDRRASQLASYLRGLGVGPEVPVGLCLERSFNYVIAALAAWKAGGAYLPIDPSWPEERRDLVMEDAEAPVLITHGALPGKARYLVDLDRHSLAIEREQSIFSPPSIKRENLAYIIYTSGSTGKPTGVEVTHGNLLNLVFWHRRAFEITSADRASHLAGLAFDAAVWELWPYLSAGASILLADDATRSSPDALRDWIATQRVTMTFVPTTLAEPMLQGSWPSSGALRYLLTGADTLQRHPVRGLPFRVVNNYGPTECTVVTTSGVVSATGAEDELPTIGAPIANAQVHLLNPHGKSVAPGETGEIYIGGTGVARGYRNQPALTAERFLCNPFSPSVGARMYRTGDLGTRLANGEIAFRGRADQQIKIRGHGIEPDEIVAVLNRHPLVRSSAVIAQGAGDDKHLVAYIVTMAGPEVRITASEIRDFAARHLPEYMVPAVFVRLDELPLNSSGKLDRAVLPCPKPENSFTGANLQFRAPRSPIEIQVAAILRELLKVDRVGLDDKFFVLGGHSLVGTQVVLRVRDRFGVPITLRHLFEAQTVAKLAAEVERQIFAQLEAITEEEALRSLGRKRQ